MATVNNLAFSSFQMPRACSASRALSARLTWRRLISPRTAMRKRSNLARGTPNSSACVFRSSQECAGKRAHPTSSRSAKLAVHRPPSPNDSTRYHESPHIIYTFMSIYRGARIWGNTNVWGILRGPAIHRVIMNHLTLYIMLFYGTLYEVVYSYMGHSTGTYSIATVRS